MTHLAPARAALDGDPGLEEVGQQLLELEQPGIARRRRSGRAVSPFAGGASASPSPLAARARLRSRTASSTSRTVSPSRDTALGQVLVEGAVGRAEQRLGVAGGELAVGDSFWIAGRQLEQAQGVRDRGPALADPGGHLLVGELELLDELLVGRRLLERVEVGAVEVLDHRLLERRGVVEHSDERRDCGEAGPAGGPPPALAGDELVPVAVERVGRGPAAARRAPAPTR